MRDQPDGPARSRINCERGSDIMKKIISALLALLMTLSLTAATALEEEHLLTLPVPAALADPAHAEVTADLYPASVQGTGYTDELALDLHWSKSASTRTDYQMILEPLGGDSRTVRFAVSGDIVWRGFNENGELTKERWENRKVDGEAVFTLEEDDRITLRLSSVFAPELSALRLQISETPAPSAEEISREVIFPLLEMHDGTAGSSLLAAQMAAGLIRFAVRSRLYAVSPTALKTSLIAALSDVSWTDDRFIGFTAHGKTVTNLMNVVSGTLYAEESDFQPVRALMEDAGVWEEVCALLNGGASACSVAALAMQLDDVRTTAES